PQGISTLPYLYSFTATTSPIDLSITWSLTPGSTLPTGFSLNQYGTLSGTTTQHGTFTFQVTASGAPFTATAQFTLILLQPYITITSPSFIDNGFVGK